MPAQCIICGATSARRPFAGNRPALPAACPAPYGNVGESKLASQGRCQPGELDDNPLCGGDGPHCAVHPRPAPPGVRFLALLFLFRTATHKCAVKFPAQSEAWRSILESCLTVIESARTGGPWNMGGQRRYSGAPEFALGRGRSHRRPHRSETPLNSFTHGAVPQLQEQGAKSRCSPTPAVRCALAGPAAGGVGSTGKTDWGRFNRHRSQPASSAVEAIGGLKARESGGITDRGRQCFAHRMSAHADSIPLQGQNAAPGPPGREPLRHSPVAQSIALGPRRRDELERVGGPN